jgi:hypothetical protein
MIGSLALSGCAALQGGGRIQPGRHPLQQQQLDRALGRRERAGQRLPAERVRRASRQ